MGRRLRKIRPLTLVVVERRCDAAVTAAPYLLPSSQSAMKHSAPDAEVSPERPSKRSKANPEPVSPTSSSPISGSTHFADVSREFLEKSDMECTLFTEEELPGADIIYIPEFVDEETANNWYAEVEKLDTCA